jgi:hypothetical protein
MAHVGTDLSESTRAVQRIQHFDSTALGWLGLPPDGLGLDPIIDFNLLEIAYIDCWRSIVGNKLVPCTSI